MLKLDYTQELSKEKFSQHLAASRGLIKYSTSFDYRHNCPYCNGHTGLTFSSTYTLGGAETYDTLVFECDGCGWWWLYRDDQFINIIDYTYSALKKFDYKSKGIALELLAREIHKSRYAIYDLSPKRMEEFVAHILKGSYDCEVIHTGKSGDGSIDVIVLDDGNPIPVQVKHRKNPLSVEGVSGVREFLGGLIVRGYKKGKFFTTASRFTKGATSEVNLALENNFVDSFEMYDCKRLIDVLGINISKRRIAEQITRPWKSLLRSEEISNMTFKKKE